VIMETLTYDHSRADLLPMLGLGFVMFGASVFLLYLGMFTDFTLSTMGQATGPFSILIVSIGTLFFVYAFFFILYLSIFPKDTIIINDRGIINSTKETGFKEVFPFVYTKKAKIDMENATPNIAI